MTLKITYFLITLSVFISGCQHTQTEVKKVVKKTIHAPIHAPAPALSLNKQEYTHQELNDIYQRANQMILAGKIQKAEDLLQRISPYSKEANKLLQRLEAPFNSALKSVENYIKKWLLRSTEVESIQIQKPSYPAIPKPDVITKMEFETTKQFNTRLSQKKSIYQKKLNKLKANYISRVKIYNSAVKAYNSEIYWEQKRRQEQVSSMRTRLLNTAINEVLGSPKITNLEYNADKEVFSAIVSASDNTVHYDIVIPVAVSDARFFKDNVSNFEVMIKMNLDGKIKPVNFKIQAHNKTYNAYLLESEDLKVITNQRSAGVVDVDWHDIIIDEIEELQVEEIIDINREYFNNLL